MPNFGKETLHNAAVATADGGVIECGGAESVVLQVVGTFTGTVTFEATVDGTNWVGVACANLNSTTRARALTATAPGLFLLDAIKGLGSVRARVSAWTDGDITVVGQASS